MQVKQAVSQSTRREETIPGHESARSGRARLTPPPPKKRLCSALVRRNYVIAASRLFAAEPLQQAAAAAATAQCPACNTGRLLLQRCGLCPCRVMAALGAESMLCRGPSSRLDQPSFLAVLFGCSFSPKHPPPPVLQHLSRLRRGQCYPQRHLLSGASQGHTHLRGCGGPCCSTTAPCNDRSLRSLSARASPCAAPRDWDALLPPLTDYPGRPVTPPPPPVRSWPPPKPPTQAPPAAPALSAAARQSHLCGRRWAARCAKSRRAQEQAGRRRRKRAVAGL